MPGGEPARYYAVARGRRTGIFETWKEVQPLLFRYKGGIVKRFDDFESASEFYHNKKDYFADTYLVGSINTSKKHDEPTIQGIYIDGACRGNGKYLSPPAGYGIYFGDNDVRNAAIPMKNQLVTNTNQRAEISAALYTLEYIQRELKNILKHGDNTKYRINTDSKYVILSITEYAKKWELRGWTRNKDNTVVANSDLIQKCREIYLKICDIYTHRGWLDLEFVHVKGHGSNKGNIEADKLANQAVDYAEARGWQNKGTRVAKDIDSD